MKVLKKQWELEVTCYGDFSKHGCGARLAVMEADLYREVDPWNSSKVCWKCILCEAKNVIQDPMSATTPSVPDFISKRLRTIPKTS